jgi:diacylglycerol O-acyltransferase
MEPKPTAAGLLSGIWDMISYEAGLAGTALTGLVRDAPTLVADGIRRPVSTAAAALSTVASIGRTARPITRPGSPIMLDRSRIRRLAIHEVPKEALHRAGAVAGGSLNDAFIAAIAGGLRRYHEKHGVTAGDLMVSMPISIRPRTTRWAVTGRR